MIMSLYKRFKAWESRFRNSFGDDISTPAARKSAWRHYLWMDHGVLRFWWHNFDQIAPDVYRSNHPHHARFKAYRDMGVKTILNLRGPGQRAHYLFEVESLDALGLALHTVQMGARKVPAKATLEALFTAFDTIEQPFIMHCKSGADRTGLASAFYLLDQCNATDTQARRQLRFRYIHIRKTKTGVLDFVLNTYLARRAATGIAVRDWVAREYDADAITQAYTAQKAREKVWQGW